MSNRANPGRPLLKPSDWIALIALFISLFSVGWQLKNALVGAEIQLLSMDGRTVSIRCSSRSSDPGVCWGDEQNGAQRPGSFTVILPVFFANTGAIGYNDIASTVTAEVEFSDEFGNIELVANQFWQLVQAGGSEASRPFTPIVIEGGSANGAELRFVAFEDQDFLAWRSVVEAIVDERIGSILFTVSAELVNSDTIVRQECLLVVSDRLRGVLTGRQAERSSQARLTTTCQQA